MSNKHMFLKTATIAFAVLLATVFFTGCGKKVNENLVKGKAAYENKDYENAVPSLLLAAQDDDAEAQYLLCRCYGEGNGVEKDQDEALKWLRKSADQGFAKAQMTLGVYYYSNRDKSEAETWFKKSHSGLRKAAKDGDTEALMMLAAAYINGWGVEEDEEEGKKLLRQAAEMGDKEAQKVVDSMKD